MRTLAITQNITLDGRVEMLGDWFDPTDQTPDLLAEVHRQDAACDAVLLGRRTFEDFRGYWPEQTDDATGITDQLNAVTKYVVSSSVADPRWRNSVVLSGIRSPRSPPSRSGRAATSWSPAASRCATP